MLYAMNGVSKIKLYEFWSFMSCPETKQISNFLIENITASNTKMKRKKNTQTQEKL